MKKKVNSYDVLKKKSRYSFPLLYECAKCSLATKLALHRLCSILVVDACTPLIVSSLSGNRRGDYKPNSSSSIANTNNNNNHIIILQLLLTNCRCREEVRRYIVRPNPF